MRAEIVGEYRDVNTSEVYTVLKRIKEITSNSLSGSSKVFDGTFDYVTSCGIDVNPLSENESSFELIQKGGIIQRLGG